MLRYVVRKLEFAHNATLESVPTDVCGRPTEQTVRKQRVGMSVTSLMLLLPSVWV